MKSFFCFQAASLADHGVDVSVSLFVKRVTVMIMQILQN